MARLPQPGGDNGNWGNILNEYLSQALKNDGTIKDNAVTSGAIAPNAVTSDAIATDAVNATSIADGSITNAQIADGTIQEAKLAAAVQTKLNAVGSGTIADGTVTTVKLQDGAVNDSKVGTNAAIAQSKIAGLTTDLAGKAATAHTHTASQLSDSTTVGRAVIIASDAAAARSAIGAGTSNLALGTTSVTAAAGNDGRLSDSRAPTGGATGDLSGTYPNPTVSKVNGVSVTGTPSVGTVLTATSATAAGWSTPTASVTSVAGRTGAVTLISTDVGLSNVDNTSDVTKNAATVTLSNKTVNLSSNTLSGTTAQFNTALSDNDFSTLAGTETLTNKTISGTNNTISAVPKSALIGTTRTGVYPFELPNNIATVTGGQPLNNRRLFRITQSAKRFRIHIKNRNQLGDANASGTVTSLSVYIGNPAADGNGEPNGNFTTTPIQVQSTTTMTSGTELITPWVSPGTFTINPYQMYMLSVGFAVPSTGEIAFGGGLTWQTYLASDAGVIAPSGMARVNNAAFMQIFIEYEFDDNDAPVILVVGNSLSNSSNAGSGDNYGELSSWPQVWARTNKGVAASLAVGGAWAAHFPSGNGRWDIYSTVNTPLDYDAIVYFALNSSDLTGGNLASAKLNMTAAISRGRALYPNARHIITNNPARVESTGAVGSSGTIEDNRILLNEWMHMLPNGVEQCIDIDAITTDWANPARIRSVYNADGTHMTPRGHAVLARAVPNMRG